MCFSLEYVIFILLSFFSLCCFSNYKCVIFIWHCINLLKIRSLTCFILFMICPCAVDLGKITPLRVTCELLFVMNIFYNIMNTVMTLFGQSDYCHSWCLHVLLLSQLNVILLLCVHVLRVTNLNTFSLCLHALLISDLNTLMALRIQVLRITWMCYCYYTSMRYVLVTWMCYCYYTSMRYVFVTWMRYCHYDSMPNVFLNWMRCYLDAFMPYNIET